MNFSKFFIRLNWFTLVFIYLVIIAGSFVRITGSGMGCPDWPKCFGQYIPPTTDANLPEDYKNIYVEKRLKKIDRFSSFLEKIGMQDVADKIRSDKSILLEQDFNARKTWTEYINRLFGVLAGFGVLFVWISVLRKYRNKKLVFLSSLNLILLVIQAWFGSIVVASNLVPWTITVHLLLALLIVCIQLILVQKTSITQQIPLITSKRIRWIIWIVFIITFIQMFLGTQVREAIDVLVKQGYSREYWVENIGLPFFIHRSFSWIVLILLAYLWFLNKKYFRIPLINLSVYILLLELISGILLAYVNMPGLVQTSHLLFACILFGTLFMKNLRMPRVD
jgi:cytochrome c oxidase assembly protein subunit 15